MELARIAGGGATPVTHFCGPLRQVRDLYAIYHAQIERPFDGERAMGERDFDPNIVKRALHGGHYLVPRGSDVDPPYDLEID